MCISHRLQCKIKRKIYQVWIKIQKISAVDYFHLINYSKWYHVYKNPTIHILDMKYGHYGSNTLSISRNDIRVVRSKRWFCFLPILGFSKLTTYIICRNKIISHKFCKCIWILKEKAHLGDSPPPPPLTIHNLTPF
jgi:hypothetical protein